MDVANCNCCNLQRLKILYLFHNPTRDVTCTSSCNSLGVKDRILIVFCFYNRYYERDPNAIAQCIDLYECVDLN